MASYIENYKSTNNILNPFKRLGAFPIDVTSMFNSIADAQKYAKYVTYTKDQIKTLTDDLKDSRNLGGTAYVGQLISVYENDKVSVFKIQPNGSLSPIGGTDTKTVTSYTEAKAISLECSVGQLIKITSPTGETEDADGKKYADGFYIVTTPGNILSLSTSSGDISTDEVAALRSALNSLTDKFTSLSNDIYITTTEEDGSSTTSLNVYTKSEVDNKISTANNDAIRIVSLSSGATVTKTNNEVSIPVITTLSGIDVEGKKAPISAGAVETLITNLSSEITNKEIIKVVDTLPEASEAKQNIIYITTVEGKKTEYVKLSEDSTELYAIGNDRFASKDVLANYYSDEAGEFISGTIGLMSGEDKYKLESISSIPTPQLSAILN